MIETNLDSFPMANVFLIGPNSSTERFKCLSKVIRSWEVLPIHNFTHFLGPFQSPLRRSRLQRGVQNTFSRRNLLQPKLQRL